MLDVLEAALYAVRFFVELAGLIALGYWGFETGRTTLQKYGLAMIAPLSAAAVWSMFVAPNASYDVPGLVRWLLEIAIFGASVLGLLAVGRARLALIFGVVALVTSVLLLLVD